MSGQHAEIAFEAGNINLVDFSGESELFRGDEIEVEGGHGLSACFTSPACGGRSTGVAGRVGGIFQEEARAPSPTLARKR
jgi:hypothetical protein